MSKQSQIEIDQMIKRSQYKNVDLVRRDINEVIQSSQCNLILNLILYNSKEYLTLIGTVICEYEGNKYNIPIEIILNENHPHQSPIARVKPTSIMSISTNNTDVQSDGIIILNCLKTWRHPNNNLRKLINLMSQSFSESPPLYSNNESISKNISLITTPIKTISLNQRENYYQESLLDKIQREFNSTIQIKITEINSLKIIEQNLNDRQNNIDLLIYNIQQQQFQIQNYLTNLKKQINKSSEKCFLKKENLINDDLIIIRYPIYKQIFQCFIEDHAIQHFLFHLVDGLKQKSISLDNYFKRVRQLSRRQFILRATIDECRQILHLSTSR